MVAALISEVWAGSHTDRQLHTFLHLASASSMWGWQHSTCGVAEEWRLHLPLLERGNTRLLDQMLYWVGVWQIGMGRGRCPPMRADEPALLCRLRRGSRKTPSGGHFMTEGLPDLRSTCLHVPACRCGNSLSTRAAPALFQGPMVQAGHSSSRALISTPRRLPMLLSRPSLLP